MAKTVQPQNSQPGKPPEFIRRITPTGTRTHKGLWRCHCGNEFEASLNNVSRGHTRSCGCYAIKIRKISHPTHGHFVGDKPTATYKSWQAMIAHCTNPKHPAYLHYGGRGINVCDRWLTSFQSFLDDVGERPIGKTLDRIETDGDYIPGNVRWSTATEQIRNRRSTDLVDIDGIPTPLAKVHADSGSLIPYGVVQKRIRRGWSYQLALSAPLNSRK